MKKWPASYKLVASVKFLLRTASELRTLGFENVPEYGIALASTNKGKYPNTKSATPDNDIESSEDDFVLDRNPLGLADLTPRSISNGRSTETQSMRFPSSVTDQEAHNTLLVLLNRDRKPGPHFHGASKSRKSSKASVAPEAKVIVEGSIPVVDSAHASTVKPESRAVLRGLEGGPANASYNVRQQKTEETEETDETESQLPFEAEQPASQGSGAEKGSKVTQDSSAEATKHEPDLSLLIAKAAAAENGIQPVAEGPASQSTKVSIHPTDESAILGSGSLAATSEVVPEAQAPPREKRPIDPEPEQARKTVVSPALRSVAEVEHLSQEANTRIEAAKAHAKKLRKDYETATLYRAEKEKARKLNEEAAMMELENIKLQAEINEIYSSD